MTLITGDRVELRTGAGIQSVRIVPRPGREGIAFEKRQTEDGRLVVVPSDAMPLLGKGLLDRRLFDVTLLMEDGYHDGARDDVPLIVSYTKGLEARTASRSTLRAAGADRVRALSSLRADAVRVSKSSTAELWEELTGERTTPDDGDGRSAAPGLLGADDGIAKVWLDGPVRASLDQSTGQIGAPAAWEAGYTGEGVTVAVLDTGIDTAHPDLVDAVVAAEDFTESGDPVDYAGHGTHVASIITGDGEASDGAYKGVAPDAELLVGKVLDDSGYGYDSQVVAGMEWAAHEGARVVTMSLGGCATDGTDPMAQAVDRLTEETGVLFVVAAGNHPADPSCFHDEVVATPAVADHALAVGSVGRNDVLSDFSNTGPRLGDAAVKPELTAPGEGIVAARAADGWMGDPVDDHYARMSGTSMAAPHVAGAAALLAEQHPGWRADELRAALLASARPNPEHTVFQQGAGRVDVAAALRQQVTTAPAILSFGRAEWPHADDPELTRRVTYRNAGDTAVTLDLEVRSSGPDGAAAPDGMVTVSPSRITVPAGGSADVEVTADTTLGGPDGHYSGALVALHDGEPVSRTAFGLDQEVESYDLTLEALDRTGARAATTVHVVDASNGYLGPVELDGTEPTRLRLPAGRYDLSAAVFTDPAEGEGAGSFTLVSVPGLRLDGDRTVRFDARDGLTVGATVDSPTAEPVGEREAWTELHGFRHGIVGNDDPNRATDLYAVPTGEVAEPFTFGFTGAYAEPLPDAGTGTTQDRQVGQARGGRAWRDVPRGYLLHLTREGGVPNPPVFRVHDRELAEVRTTVHGDVVHAPTTGRLTAHVVEPNGLFGTPLGYEVEVPGRRIDLYSGGPDLEWATELATDRGYEIDYFGDAGRHYVPGRSQAKHWGRAALGPFARPHHGYGRLWAAVGEFSSSASGQVGWTEPVPGIEAEATLFRDGEPVGTNHELGGGTFDVPSDDAATYELAVRATRAVPWSALATEVDARWTFRGPFTEFVPAAAPNLRVSGGFDLLNRAPADRAFPLRVQVESGDGSTPTITEIGLAASFDDGATWTPLRLSARPDGGYRALVPTPPEGARFVALRGFVEDADGNRVEQTVLRAYGLKR